jgi:hypothetical protein
MDSRDEIGVVNKFGEHIRMRAGIESHHRTISDLAIWVRPILDDEEITWAFKEWFDSVGDDNVQVKKKTRSR